MITAIGTAMIDVLKREGLAAVMWGDADLLERAYRLSGAKSKRSHPLDKFQHVLNALDRDTRFEKRYMSIDIFRSGSRLVRVFRMIGYQD